MQVQLRRVSLPPPKNNREPRTGYRIELLSGVSLRMGLFVDPGLARYRCSEQGWELVRLVDEDGRELSMGRSTGGGGHPRQ